MARHWALMKDTMAFDLLLFLGDEDFMDHGSMERVHGEDIPAKGHMDSQSFLHGFGQVQRLEQSTHEQ